jgi:hypothetical protein
VLGRSSYCSLHHSSIRERGNEALGYAPSQEAPYKRSSAPPDWHREHQVCRRDRKDWIGGRRAALSSAPLAGTHSVRVSTKSGPCDIEMWPPSAVDGRSCCRSFVIDRSRWWRWALVNNRRRLSKDRCARLWPRCGGVGAETHARVRCASGSDTWTRERIHGRRIHYCGSVPTRHPSGGFATRVDG